MTTEPNLDRVQMNSYAKYVDQRLLEFSSNIIVRTKNVRASNRLRYLDYNKVIGKTVSRSQEYVKCFVESMTHFAKRKYIVYKIRSLYSLSHSTDILGGLNCKMGHVT